MGWQERSPDFDIGIRRHLRNAGRSRAQDYVFWVHINISVSNVSFDDGNLLLEIRDLSRTLADKRWTLFLERWRSCGSAVALRRRVSVAAHRLMAAVSSSLTAYEEAVGVASSAPSSRRACERRRASSFGVAGERVRPLTI